MADAQQLAPVPPITLDTGYTVTFEAINPSTGAAVSGVTISAATLFVSSDTVTVVPEGQSGLLTFEPLV